MRTLTALLVAAVVAAAPAHAGERLLATNGLRVEGAIANTGPEGAEHCQEPERIPAGTNAIRLSLRPIEGDGPVVRVRVVHLADREDPRPFATGARAAGWSGDAVTVPLRRALRHGEVGTVCLRAPGVPMSILGTHRTRTDPRQSEGPMRIDYLRVTGAPADAATPAWSGFAAALLAVLVALGHALAP